eukprot:TRINITY_DN1089_c0_g1_i10.p1 TRINITY_DN1089_c0_g1~~TRINITY_DN1089_c0_g1_i10.p1  ORF type:complete len:355 (-),score=39.73 TRINITY_DN1089_c0_g1_i10:169-1188(-)
MCIRDRIYTRLDSKNVMQTPVGFPLKSGCRVVKISTDLNPKNLVIAFEGKRQVNLGVCNRTNSGGCYDIYTVLSKDLGKTWDPINVVPRSSANDIAERLNPHLAFSPRSGQAYVFYTQRQISSPEAKLLYVFKNKNDAKFKTEQLIEQKSVTRIIDTVTTKEKLTTKVHVFYEADNKVKHKYIDEENMWNEGSDLDSKYHYTRFVAAESTIVAIYTDGVNSYFKYSSNHGKDWSTPSNIEKNYHKLATAVLKSKENNKFELSLLTTGFMSKDPAFKSIEIPGGSVTPLEPPFKDSKNYGIFMAQLRPHTKDSEENLFRAFGYIWGNGTAPSVFFSDYVK